MDAYQLGLSFDPLITLYILRDQGLLVEEGCAQGRLTNDMSRLENIITYKKFCNQGIVILKFTSFVIDFNPCHSVDMLVN